MYKCSINFERGLLCNLIEKKPHRLAPCQLHVRGYKKHIDASVKERSQALLVPSEEICKHVLCNKHI